MAEFLIKAVDSWMVNADKTGWDDIKLEKASRQPIQGDIALILENGKCPEKPCPTSKFWIIKVPDITIAEVSKLIDPEWKVVPVTEEISEHQYNKRVADTNTDMVNDEEFQIYGDYFSMPQIQSTKVITQTRRIKKEDWDNISKRQEIINEYCLTPTITTFVAKLTKDGVKHYYDVDSEINRHTINATRRVPKARRRYRFNLDLLSTELKNELAKERWCVMNRNDFLAIIYDKHKGKLWQS